MQKKQLEKISPKFFWEKIAFKVVQIKSLAKHITDQKLSFDYSRTFTKYLNILMIFWHKRKIDNFDPYNVFLAIATNLPVLLMTGFVIQGHI